MLDISRRAVAENNYQRILIGLRSASFIFFARRGRYAKRKRKLSAGGRDARAVLCEETKQNIDSSTAVTLSSDFLIFTRRRCPGLQHIPSCSYHTGATSRRCEIFGDARLLLLARVTLLSWERLVGSGICSNSSLQLCVCFFPVYVPEGCVRGRSRRSQKRR